MTKIINFDLEARTKLQKGVDTLANAVSVTLGPRGRNVIFSKPHGAPQITKDGVTVAKEIDLDDPIENMGAQLVKEVASKTNELAGDGTTTATVLTQSIFNDGLKYVAAGANPMDLKRGIDSAVKCITQELRKISKPISTDEEIIQIATISANNDKVIGNLIGEAMNKVGKDGVITVEEAKGTEIEVKTVEGMQFDKGYLSPYFVTNQETMVCELETPYILLYDKRISSMNDLLPILEQVSTAGRSLLIIAEDIDGEALGTLVVNKLRGILEIAAVKAPAFGDRRKSILEDTAVITGGTVISAEAGLKLEDVTLDHLGTCEKINIDKSTTTFINGGGDIDLIKKRIDVIKHQIENSTSDYDIENLQERLAKISGGVAIIYIGATTEVELKEKKARVDDALHATRAAVEEGIVIGGGLALIQAAKALEKWVVETDDENLGIKIIESAIYAPFNKIVENAGKTPEVILNKVQNSPENFGYDARTDEFVDMIRKGIIDPTKVTRLSLEHSASVAGLLLTTECAIATKKDDSVAVQPQIPMI